MKRSVMKIGPNTLAVSLPASWTKRFNILKGDELEVIEREKGLQITTKKEFSLDKKSIAISQYNPLIMRTLGVLYKAGYNELQIQYEEGKKTYQGKEYREIDLIKRAVESYSGMDIKEIKKENNSQSIVIVERSHLLPSEFKNTLNQAFLHLTFLAEEISEALVTNNREMMDKANLTDNLINQTTNFCQKVLNKSGYEQFTKTSFMYSIVVGIEQLGDTYRELYGKYLNSPAKAGKELMSTYQQTTLLLNEFYALYRKFDSHKFAQLGDACQRNLNVIEKLLETCSRKELHILFFINHIVIQIQTLLEPLASLYHESLE